VIFPLPDWLFGTLMIPPKPGAHPPQGELLRK
jgi:hypothetical protein